MKVLVAGLLPHDSGKTSVAASLTSELRARGVDAVAAKPVGAHSAWSQHHTVKLSFELGLLVGEDAYILWNASERAEPIELMSPLDVMTAPPDLAKARLYATQLTHQAVLIRVSQLSEALIQSRHLAISENMASTTPPLRSKLEKLASELKAAPVERSRVADIILEASTDAERSLRELESRHELTIVESYNDAVAPTPSLNYYAVIAVAPGRALVYWGDRYRLAAKAARYQSNQLTTDKIAPLLTPAYTVPLYPREKSSLYTPREDTEKLAEIMLKALEEQTTTESSRPL